MIELNVPFMEKEEAKRLGARWNGVSKRWYIPAGVDRAPLLRWLPKGVDLLDLDTAIVEQGGHGGLPLRAQAPLHNRTEYSLSAFLYKISDVIQKNIIGASWVSAEISELRANKGHLFITLVEHDEQGNMVARTSARIWQTDVERLNTKFKQGTGSDLEAGLKVLIYARVEFHPQYALSLFIDDIDPSYTLGDMAAKLAKIREVLTTEKIINNNRNLPKPIDFTHVAVVSPQNAAGLGDFNREAGILQKHGLCDFSYFTATFQGEQAPADICRAIDLAVLQHEHLARVLCLCPIHVMAGIGHERDYTIIDEVAGERFDTPSKVAQRIFNLITGNAIEAETNYSEISRKVRQFYKYSHYVLDKLRQEIAHSTNNLFQRLQERLSLIYQQLGSQALQACTSLEKQLTIQISEILNQSPAQILKKGFALISNTRNKIISSKLLASQQQQLQIEFYDGKLRLKVEILNEL